MKQLLFLLLFPCLALAQYPGNAGQKITLGEQTTADGLVYRGVAADTTKYKFTIAYQTQTSSNRGLLIIQECYRELLNMSSELYLLRAIYQAMSNSDYRSICITMQSHR
jgi:hypothetical protein